MDIFDDFITQSDYSNSVSLAIQSIDSIADDMVMDEYHQPDWDASTKTTINTFGIPYADATNYFRKRGFILDEDSVTFIVPAELITTFNKFSKNGVNYRIVADSLTYEVVIYDTDSLFDQTSVIIVLKQVSS